jgi:hypothetical protein
MQRDPPRAKRRTPRDGSQERAGFRNLSTLPEVQPLVRSIGKQPEKIPGIQPDTSKVRVFSEKEFEATVKANERHFTRGRR